MYNNINGPIPSLAHLEFQTLLNIPPSGSWFPRSLVPPPVVYDHEERAGQLTASHHPLLHLHHGNDLKNKQGHRIIFYIFFSFQKHILKEYHQSVQIRSNIFWGLMGYQIVNKGYQQEIKVNMHAYNKISSISSHN